MKFLAAFFMSAIFFTANAQFRDIPSVVTDSFIVRFPKATHVSWKDKVTAFQAEFDQNNEELRVYYSSKGEWLKTERKVEMLKLPSSVKDGFNKSKYAAYSISDITETIDHEKGLLYKVIAARKGSITKRVLYFTDKGQLVKDDMNF